MRFLLLCVFVGLMCVNTSADIIKVDGSLRDVGAEPRGPDIPFTETFEYDRPSAYYETVDASFEAILEDQVGGFGYGSWFLSDNPITYAFSCGIPNCEYIYSVEYYSASAPGEQNGFAYTYFWGADMLTDSPTIDGGWITMYQGGKNYYSYITPSQVTHIATSPAASAVPEPSGLLMSGLMLLTFWIRRSA